MGLGSLFKSGLWQAVLPHKQAKRQCIRAFSMWRHKLDPLDLGLYHDNINEQQQRASVDKGCAKRMGKTLDSVLTFLSEGTGRRPRPSGDVSGAWSPSLPRVPRAPGSFELSLQSPQPRPAACLHTQEAATVASSAFQRNIVTCVAYRGVLLPPQVASLTRAVQTRSGGRQLTMSLCAGCAHSNKCMLRAGLVCQLVQGKVPPVRVVHTCHNVKPTQT